MTWWIYKCRFPGREHQRHEGDWDDCWKRAAKDNNGESRWGSRAVIPELGKLLAGDMVIACQSNRKELVGVLEVIRFDGDYLILKPGEVIRIELPPLKKADPKIAAISVLKPGSRRTLYRLRDEVAIMLVQAAQNWRDQRCHSK